MKYQILENGYKIYPGNVSTYMMDLLKASSLDPNYKLRIRRVNGVLKVTAVKIWRGLE